MKTCWLAGGSDSFADGFLPQNGDLVIAVDAGFEKLRKLNITPDIAVGDFDSLGYQPDFRNTITHPCQKDDTDMMLAVQLGLSEDCDRFMIFGGTGGRIAHTLGNLQVLAFLANKEKACFLIDSGYTVTAAEKSTLCFPAQCTGYVSLLAWGCKSARVSISGLKYELEKSVLPSDRPLGISNEFIGKNAEVTVHEGTVIIVIEDCGILPERDGEKS